MLIQSITLAILLSVVSPIKPDAKATIYNGAKNAGVCVEIDATHNEVCVETQGVVGVYLCNPTLSEDCGKLDVTLLKTQGSNLDKVAKLFDCTIDMSNAEPYCYMPGEVESVEDETITHDGGIFWKVYNSVVNKINLPALTK